MLTFSRSKSIALPGERLARQSVLALRVAQFLVSLMQPPIGRLKSRIHLLAGVRLAALRFRHAHAPKKINAATKNSQERPAQGTAGAGDLQGMIARRAKMNAKISKIPCGDV
jgi:hypothetical protein